MYTHIELVSIRQEIGLLRDENKKQNLEISSMKEMIKSHDEKIDKNIIKKLDQRKAFDESSMASDHNNQHLPGRTRQKRPYRLIPTAQKKRPNENNENNKIILIDHQKTSIFYGPPTNCSDLSRLGYTLNGYWLLPSQTSYRYFQY